MHPGCGIRWRGFLTILMSRFSPSATALVRSCSTKARMFLKCTLRVATKVRCEAMRVRNAQVIQERRKFSAAALYRYPQKRANWFLRTQAR